MKGFPYRNITRDVSYRLSTPDGTLFKWEPGETVVCHERLLDVPFGLSDLKPLKGAKKKQVSKNGSNSKTDD